MSTLTIIILIICLLSLLYLCVVYIIIPRKLSLPKIDKKVLKKVIIGIIITIIAIPALILGYYMLEYPLLALIAAPFIFFLPLKKW